MSTEKVFGEVGLATLKSWADGKFALITQSGYKVNLEMDSTTFVITPKLYDKNDTLISTGSSVDLPVESVVVNGSYDNVNKKIILTLKSGSTIDVPVGDLVAGLYSKPSGGIPKTDLASAVQTSLDKADSALQSHQDISGKVDKVVGKGLSTEDYTTAEKTKLGNLEVPTTTTVTIETSDWLNESCTKTVTGMTSNKNVLVAPAPSSFSDYTDAGIRCTAQGTNSLTFVCDSVPSSSVMVNILILG